MRQVVEIKDDVISEIKKITGEKIYLRALNKALEEFIRQKKREEIIQYFGKGILKLKYSKRELERMYENE